MHSIKIDAQKKMIESSFGRRFHDLNYIEVEFVLKSLKSLSN